MHVNINIISIIPEIIIVVFSLLILMLSAFVGKKFDKFVALLSALAVFLSLISVFLFNFYNQASAFNNSFLTDNFANFFRIFTLIAALIFIGISHNYIKESVYIKRHLGEFYFLILTIIVGTMLMSSSGDLIMLFISLELVSIPSYILAGYEKMNSKSNEAALKYFILGVLATAILAYGFSIIYGATGEVNLKEIARVVTNKSLLSSTSIVSDINNLNNLNGIANDSANINNFINVKFGGNFVLIIGIIMSLVGFGFKVGAAPFHWWAPDTYEGSPTIITTLITTIVKIAAFSGLIRFLFVGFGSFGKSLWIVLFIILLSLLSVILGNLIALPQKNFKRLMAYSSIAHAGYIMIGFAVATIEVQFAIFIYLMAYISMNLGAFAVAMLVEGARKSEEISAFAGIGQTNPFISICMVIFLISMVGLPPFAGFLGKLFVFKAGVENNLTWLVIIGVLTSVISLWYYVKIIRHMFFVKYEGDESAAKIIAPKLTLILIALLALFTIAMVVVPAVFISISKSAVVFF